MFFRDLLTSLVSPGSLVPTIAVAMKGKVFDGHAPRRIAAQPSASRSAPMHSSGPSTRRIPNFIHAQIWHGPSLRNYVRAGVPTLTRAGCSGRDINILEWYDESMSSKQRLSATVDVTVLAAAQAAVADGRAANISAWVNQALHRQAEHDRRMRALDDFLGAYESEHGVITDEEMRAASRRAHARAIVVRGKPSTKRSTRQRRAQGPR